MDDLREKDLINGLKLSTEDFQPVTAFQVSEKGVDFVRQLPQEIKDPVDKYTRSPAGNLLQVKFVANEPADEDDNRQVKKKRERERGRRQ